MEIKGLELNLDDINNGNNDWTNIQDVIRQSFLNLTQIITNQQKEITTINKKLEDKVSISNLKNELNQKVNKFDLKEKLDNIISQNNEKLSIQDFEKHCKEFINNNEFEVYKKIINDKFKMFESNLNLKSEKCDIEIKFNRLNEYYNNLKLENDKTVKIENFNSIMFELKGEIQEKIELKDFKLMLDEKLDIMTLHNELDKLVSKEDFERFLLQKADSEEVDKIIEILENKADIVDIDKIYKILEQKTNKNDMFKLENEISKKSNKNTEESMKKSFNLLKHDFEKYSFSINKNLELLKSENYENIENVNLLMKDIKLKINKKELDIFKSKLESKISKNDINVTFKTYENDMKLEISDQVKLLKNEFYNKNEEFINLNNILKININKNNVDIDTIKSNIDNIIENISNETNDIQNLIKNNSVKIKNEFNSKIETNFKELSTLKDLFSYFKDNSIDMKDYLKFKSNVNNDLKSKINIKDIQGLLSNYQLETSEKLVNFKHELKNLLKNKDVEFKKLLSNKIDKHIYQKDLDLKIDLQVFEETINEFVKNQDIQKLIRKYELINENDINFNWMQDQVNLIKENSDNIIKKINLKADLKDIVQVLDKKVNIDQINSEFEKIYSNFNNLCLKSDLKEYVNEQEEMNEFLCTENIVVRYKWKSGNLLNGNFVPWENMVINTLPDNFILDSNKYTILISTTGLYEVALNFYSIKKPNFSLLVNGEIISQSITNNKSKIIQIKGNKILEYLWLPARSNLTVLFNGDQKSEGFINIKRL